MGIRSPGATSGLFDPKIVEALIEAEKMPIESAKKRKENTVKERDEVKDLDQKVTELDVALNGIKSKPNFYKLKVESSHPDIIDGVITGPTLTGVYEFEVRGLAKAEKELAYGFPDKDETEVGFGYMLIEREDLDDVEVIIEPGSTLNDVVQAINDADAGVKALVINTKYYPESYRLLVISEQSGKEAKVYIDEDTTFLEFKEQVSGRNLDVLFEDVPVTDEDNDLDELVDGIVFNAKRSEPGTRVQVSILHDIDATMEAIQEFINKYNEVAKFISDQFVINPQTRRAGTLAADSTIKSVQRQLQQAVAGVIPDNGSFSTLAEIGITTEPKTGLLNMDDSKVRGALAEDYDSVANLFIRRRESTGVGERIAQKIRILRDPVNGVLKSRLRGLDQVIQNQDEVIADKERRMEQREQAIRRRFTALEGQLSGLKAQGDFLKARMGGGAQGGGQQG